MAFISHCPVEDDGIETASKNELKFILI